MDALEAGYKWVEPKSSASNVKARWRITNRLETRQFELPIVDLFIERWKRRGWQKIVYRFVVYRTNPIETLLQQLREITYNWSWGLTGRHGCPISEAHFAEIVSDIPGATSSKLIFRIAIFIEASSLSTSSFKHQRGEKFGGVAKIRWNSPRIERNTQRCYSLELFSG